MLLVKNPGFAAVRTNLFGSTCDCLLVLGFGSVHVGRVLSASDLLVDTPIDTGMSQI